MFEDYQKAVRLAYIERKEKGQLSPNLQYPSPAKLRDECIIVFSERFIKKDEDTLRAFFGAKNDLSDYNLNIRNVDIDRFRPLVNFLNGGTTKPDVKIVELLAWLIDFNPRPKVEWSNVKKPIDANETEESISTIPHVELMNQRPLILAIIAVLIIAAGYSAFHFYSLRSQKCMYWTGENYKTVSCNTKVDNVVVIARDNIKLEKVKKITRVDTLTSYSIRRIWYTKSNGNIEFYTDSSTHPTDQNKRMLPMTAYIYQKYVLNNR